MGLVLITSGTDKLVKSLVGSGGTFDVKVGLFVNNIVPLPTNVLADFVEPTDTGYAKQSVSHTAWTFHLESGEWVARAPAVSFALAGPDTLYGYFVTDNPVTEVLWCERSPLAPFAFPAGSPPVSLALSMLLISYES